LPLKAQGVWEALETQKWLNFEESINVAQFIDHEANWNRIYVGLGAYLNYQKQLTKYY